MKIFPAIDIKNGHCVILKRNLYHDAIIYLQSPKTVAKGWEQQGAEAIHIVDVDGALVGHISNEEAIQKIVNAVQIPVEAGGGIRTIQDIERLMNLGVDRVVIGTKAVGNPGFIKDAIHLFGAERIIVSIDAKNGMVAVKGWEQISNYNAVSLAVEMRELGVKTIHYSDLSPKGQKLRPNIEHIREMVQASGLRVVVKGGITSMKDLEMVKQSGVYGTILDCPLYEEEIYLNEAISFAR